MRTTVVTLLGLQACIGAIVVTSPAWGRLVIAVLCLLTITGILWSEWRAAASRTSDIDKIVEEKVSARTNDLMEMMTRYEQAAVTDALTGLLNRRGGEESLRHHVARSLRIKTAFSIIFVDLDHFKAINDNHGHSVGDVVIAETSKTIQRHLRAADFAVRWGGEEILVCLPDTDLVGAILVAEKLRAAIESMDLEIQVRVTASFGCAELGDDGLAITIARADMNLYVAKTRGRNQVWPNNLEKDP